MTALLTVWSFARGALAKAWALIARYPWQFACAALLIAFLWTRSDLADEKASHTADIAAWESKVKAVTAARDKAKTDAKEAAGNAQDYHDKLAAADAGLEQYIRDHRVQPQQCARSSAGAGAGGAAGVPAQPAPVSVVEVSEPDIRACDSAYVYAMSAYQWGQELAAKGLASQ